MKYKQRDYKQHQELVVKNSNGIIQIFWGGGGQQGAAAVSIELTQDEFKMMIGGSKNMPPAWADDVLFVAESTKGHVCFYESDPNCPFEVTGDQCEILGVELRINRYGDAWFTIYTNRNGQMIEVRRRIMHHYVHRAWIEYLKDTDPEFAQKVMQKDLYDASLAIYYLLKFGS